jgi:4-amino-4-deoxy-L-arabinose transferase-like glycosyltransferase
VPWIFLGLGWLAKGPLHLVFFYAIVIAVLWRAGKMRSLWNFPHLVGIIVMLSIFAAWAIPFAQATGGGHTTHVWSKQFSGRLAPDKFDLGSWAMNIPRSLGYLMPWLVLIALVARRQLSQLQGALLGAIALTLIAVDLVPGSLPRYTMPLIAPFAWLIASVLTGKEVTWPRWLGGKSFSAPSRQRIVAGIVVVTCFCLCIYALTIVPRLQSRQKIKTIATQIEGAVPNSERLFAVDPDYQPFLFYVRRNIVYVSHVEDLPVDARYFLVQPANETAAENARQWSRDSIHRLLSIKDYRGSKVVLFGVGAP